MRIFISAGEPSGDLHGANLARCLQRLHPGVELVGFGGPHMEAANCRLLYPLTQLAVMWFVRVLAHAHVFLQIVSQADRYFSHHKPDAVVLIDYPGLHWWLARRARYHGIPVFYFVPPQLWAWAGWRVEKMRRFVDHVLCSLPFEEEWYRQRGVKAHFVGHPYFDELPQQRLDDAFVNEQSGKGGPIVGLLPGSRSQEVDRNLGSLLRAASRVHAARPDARFLFACYKQAHREQVVQRLRSFDIPAEVHVGRTTEIIHLSQACAAVSGSVGLELLYRGKPSAVVYRVSSFDMKLCQVLKTSDYISLVNLLAGEELFPEFLSVRCEAEGIANYLVRWLNDPAEYAAVTDKLAALRGRVAEAGACERAARFVLEKLALTDGLQRKAAA